MNILFGSLLTAHLPTFCAYCCWDVWAECRFQTVAAEREELLDRLWADQ